MVYVGFELCFSSVWQMDVETQQKLISLYYALDNSVAR